MFRQATTAIAAVSAGLVFTVQLRAAAASLQLIGPVLPTDVSADGSVVVGNTPSDFETFRWTQATGVVPLGRATVPALNIGGGSPDVSWDGTTISATILNKAGTQTALGRWTVGDGWQELTPLPAGATPANNDAATAWGLSGDGGTLVGSFYTTNSRVHALRWTATDGAVDLGAPPNQSSRASAVNYNGTVVGGFEAHSSGFPNRLPTVWVNGVKTVLGTPVVDSEVYATNADGTVVGGNWRDASDPVRGAALWRFNGTNWNLQKLGVLPGTAPDTAGAKVDDISADGSIVVGFNRFNNDFLNNATGFYWSQATGLISADQLFTNLGLTVPAGLQIQELTSVSADGSTIAGIGLDAVGYQGFIISVPEPAGLAILALAVPFCAHRRRSRRA